MCRETANLGLPSCFAGVHTSGPTGVGGSPRPRLAVSGRERFALYQISTKFERKFALNQILIKIRIKCVFNQIFSKYESNLHDIKSYLKLNQICMD